MNNKLVAPLITLFLRSVRDEDWPQIMDVLRKVIAIYERDGSAGVKALVGMVGDGLAEPKNK